MCQALFYSTTLPLPVGSSLGPIPLSSPPPQAQLKKSLHKGCNVSYQDAAESLKLSPSPLKNLQIIFPSSLIAFSPSLLVLQ